MCSYQLAKYVVCECFYSTIDAPYFEFNEFRAILGVDDEEKVIIMEGFLSLKSVFLEAETEKK